MTDSRLDELDNSLQSDNLVQELFPEISVALNFMPIVFIESKLDAHPQKSPSSLPQLNLKQPEHCISPAREIIDLTTEESVRAKKRKKLQTVKVTKQPLEQAIEVKNSEKRARIESAQQQLPTRHDSYFSNFSPELRHYAHRFITYHFSKEQIVELANTTNAIGKFKKLADDYRTLKAAGFKNKHIFSAIISEGGLEKIAILLQHRFRIKERNFNIDIISEILQAENWQQEFSTYMQHDADESKPTVKQESQRFFKAVESSFTLEQQRLGQLANLYQVMQLQNHVLYCVPYLVNREQRQSEIFSLNTFRY